MQRLLPNKFTRPASESAVVVVVELTVGSCCCGSGCCGAESPSAGCSSTPFEVAATGSASLTLLASAAATGGSSSTATGAC